MKKVVQKRNGTDNFAWDVLCEPPILEKLKTEEKFWQIIALARSINVLSFAHWSVLPFWEDRSLHGQRTRTNLFFFTCAALYEALLLVEKMNKNFHTDNTFAKLKSILKDQTAQKLRGMHLKRARNHMVFHFAPESFGEIVNIPGESMCSFVAGLGNDRAQRYYTFADVLAMEYFVGHAANNSEKFYESLDKLMLSTRQLTADFVDAAEHLIKHSLAAWGFQIRQQPISKGLAAAKRKIAKRVKAVGIG
ncbi:MAG: hypothetical protein LAO78_26765 [Acidobacteriia bacterium]|nr:hypothetical protein [Terriglobia bacterium]